MAADTSTSTTTAGVFSVERWLEVILWSSYTDNFREQGYVNYDTCVNLSEKTVHAVVSNRAHHTVWVLMDRIKELRKFREKDAVKILWVSTRNKCTVCMKGILLSTAFSAPLLYTLDI